MISIGVIKIVLICLATDLTTGTVAYRLNKMADERKKSNKRIKRLKRGW